MTARGPVAAVDVGTNSARLLVAEEDGQGGLRELVRRTEIVRLGAGVDRTGRLDPQALQRTRAALADYAGLIHDHGVAASCTRLVATSATRDASNGSDFSEIVEGTLGIEPHVATGNEEAALTFVGATRELAGAGGGPFLVVDIGGGSTEAVRGGAVAERMRSVDIGCVRLTERHLRAGSERPPTADEVAALRADVDEALDALAEGVPLEDPGTLLCVAGTATTVAALAHGLTSYDPARLHRSVVDAHACDRVVDRLLSLTTAGIAAEPVVHAGRADVLTAGALILQAVLARTRAPGYTASEHDILDGIAWSVIDE